MRIRDPYATIPGSHDEPVIDTGVLHRLEREAREWYVAKMSEQEFARETRYLWPHLSTVLRELIAAPPKNQQHHIDRVTSLLDRALDTILTPVKLRELVREQWRKDQEEAEDHTHIEGGAS